MCMAHNKKINKIFHRNEPRRKWSDKELQRWKSLFSLYVKLCAILFVMWAELIIQNIVWYPLISQNSSEPSLFSLHSELNGYTYLKSIGHLFFFSTLVYFPATLFAEGINLWATFFVLFLSLSLLLHFVIFFLWWCFSSHWKATIVNMALIHIHMYDFV